MTGLYRLRRWATLVLIAGLLGAAVSGCTPYHGAAGHGGTTSRHAH